MRQPRVYLVFEAIHSVSDDNNQAPFLSLKKEKSQYVWLKVVNNRGKLKERKFGESSIVR